MVSAYAGETRTWSQADYPDFEKGVVKHLSVRSDGLLTLAPRFEEIFDSSATYLWAVAQDSKGTIYAGGGPGAKLFRISPAGEKKTLAEFDALEVQALAIDSKDQVYAATSPDGKVYRIAGNARPELFYDPKAKYIWALAFDRGGNLLVATGDPGAVHRVSPDGKGAIFFRSDETHIRSIAVDPKGNLIAGTDPGGLVIRVSQAGDGFVLYQMGKKEVTAVAIAPDGVVYAAGVGNKQPATTGTPPPVAPIPVPAPSPAGAGGAAQITIRPGAPSPPVPQGTVNISGGSEIYRIEPNGDPQKVWSDDKDIVYALCFDSGGHLLAGTGNKGFIYRIDSAMLYTALLNAPPTQITAFAAGRDGSFYAATGNVGKVYKIGPGLEREGTIESDVFDAEIFSHWGRLSFDGELNGGQIAIAARSGNLDQPQKNWSAWSQPVTSPKGERISIPPARFAQWKATLRASSNGQSPSLGSVDLAYLPKNVAPRVELVEITPANYRFPAPPATITTTPTLSLPPLRKHPPATVKPAASDTSTPAMQYAKGYLGVRWNAADENGDELIYTLEIRGVHETGWKPLKDKIKQKYTSWDSTGFSDGEYRIRVTASDSPDNPPQSALSASLESDVFLIDNTPPQISGLAATRNGGALAVRFRAADALSDIKSAEYSLDGGEWTVLAPASGLSDSPQLDYAFTLSQVPAGEHTIAVRVQDDYDNLATEKTLVKQ